MIYMLLESTINLESVLRGNMEVKNWLYKVIWLVALAVIACFSLSAHGIEQTSSENGHDIDYIAAPKMISAEMKACLHYVDDTISAERTFCGQETAALLLTEEERYLLAKIAMAEAEGEDTQGKALVMLVVLNRVKSDGFPNTIEDVIYQPRQFSPVASGRFERMEPNQDCWKALSMIEENGWDGSMGATYFESKGDSTWHMENLHFLFKYGGHYFYSERDGDDGE